MPEKNHWKYLIDRFTSNTCTREEFDLIMLLIENGDDVEELTELMRIHWENTSDEGDISSVWRERLENILQESNPEETVEKRTGKIRILRSYKWIAAAVIIIITSGYLGLKFGLNASGVGVVHRTATRADAPIAASRNKATLVLADGRRINLDTANNGTLAMQGSVKIIKGEEGEILYYPDRQKTITAGDNLVITPKGGKYMVVLSDGTKVWLNAASSIRFPAVFTNGIRNVALNGEAYFEVAKNVTMPFHVKVGDMNVRVLGTHFNINAYSEEEHILTTLIEGAVKVSTNKNISRGIILKPGQQAKLINSNKEFTIDHSANIGEILAWKNGNFEFVNAPVPVIMREIGRWYDLDIVYKKNALLDKRLTGTFSRNMKLDQLIAMLRYAGIGMNVDSNKLFILPN